MITLYEISLFFQMAVADLLLLSGAALSVASL